MFNVDANKGGGIFEPANFDFITKDGTSHKIHILKFQKSGFAPQVVWDDYVTFIYDAVDPSTGDVITYKTRQIPRSNSNLKDVYAWQETKVPLKIWVNGHSEEAFSSEPSEYYQAGKYLIRQGTYKIGNSEKGTVNISVDGSNWDVLFVNNELITSLIPQVPAYSDDTIGGLGSYLILNHRYVTTDIDNFSDLFTEMGILYSPGSNNSDRLYFGEKYISYADDKNGFTKTIYIHFLDSKKTVVYHITQDIIRTWSKVQVRWINNQLVVFEIYHNESNVYFIHSGIIDANYNITGGIDRNTIRKNESDWITAVTVSEPIETSRNPELDGVGYGVMISYTVEPVQTGQNYRDIIYFVSYEGGCDEDYNGEVSITWFKRSFHLWNLLNSQTTIEGYPHASTIPTNDTNPILISDGTKVYQRERLYRSEDDSISCGTVVDPGYVSEFIELANTNARFLAEGYTYSNGDIISGSGDCIVLFSENQVAVYDQKNHSMVSQWNITDGITYNTNRFGVGKPYEMNTVNKAYPFLMNDLPNSSWNVLGKYNYFFSNKTNNLLISISSRRNLFPFLRYLSIYDSRIDVSSRPEICMFIRN